MKLTYKIFLLQIVLFFVVGNIFVSFNRLCQNFYSGMRRVRQGTNINQTVTALQQKTDQHMKDLTRELKRRGVSKKSALWLYYEHIKDLISSSHSGVSAIGLSAISNFPDSVRGKLLPLEIKQIEPLLKYSNPINRAVGCYSLSELGSKLLDDEKEKKRIIDKLLDMFDDSSKMVRKEAVRGVAKFGTLALKPILSVPITRKAIWVTDSNLKKTVAWSLGELDILNDQVEQLVASELNITNLQSPNLFNPEVLKSYIRLAGELKITNSNIVDRIGEELLFSSEVDIARTAAWALGEISTPKASRFLNKALFGRAGKFLILDQVIASIGKLKIVSSEVLDEFRKIYKQDTQGNIKRAVAVALYRRGKKQEGKRKLYKLSNSNFPGFKAVSAIGFGQLLSLGEEDPKIIDKLISLCDDTSKVVMLNSDNKAKEEKAEVRYFAAKALGNYKGSFNIDMMDKLIELTKVKNEKVAVAAIDSLGRLKFRDIRILWRLEDIIRKSHDINMKLSAISSIAKIGIPNAVNLAILNDVSLGKSRRRLELRIESAKAIVGLISARLGKELRKKLSP